MSPGSPLSGGAPLRLLLVEDDPLDREIVQRLLDRAGVQVALEHAADLAAALAGFERPHDCALVDLGLPDGSGLELLRLLQERGVQTPPIVVLTGHDDMQTASDCLQAGAQDYLVKGRFASDGLLRAIRYARERWSLLQQLVEQAEALRRSNVELERFAHVASHDLQEPLRTLQTLGARLEQRAGPALDERSREYVRRMSGSARRMQRLIRDLLELSRVQTARARPERVSVADLVARVVSDLSACAEEAGATVRLDLPDGLPPVEGVRSHLERALGNLLANALRYRHPGRPPQVLVAAWPLPPGARDARGRRALKARVELTVQDDGIGFEPDEAEHVFRPFNRLNAEDEEGTGIGLALCKAVIERHGGAIGAEGRPGQGATFTFTLPSLGEGEGTAER